MIEIKPYKLDSFVRSEISKIALSRQADGLIKYFKDKLEPKFPLYSTDRMGITFQENRILTENSGVFTISYFPFDESRTDKEEQLKISNDKTKKTIIIKSGKDNPQISFELFEQNDNQPERKIYSQSNNYEAIREANFVIGQLRKLNDFDLVYKPQDFNK
jgi:hypothetical protein